MESQIGILERSVKNTNSPRKPGIEQDGAGDDLWLETLVLVIDDGLVNAEPSIDNLLSQKQCESALRHVRQRPNRWQLHATLNQNSLRLKIYLPGNLVRLPMCRLHSLQASFY
jgi:hypothetical protein